MQLPTDSLATTLMMKDIAKTSPLGKDEETILLKLAKNGNRAARDRIILANMRFVLGVALRFRTSPLSVGEMVNDGILGMRKAIDEFDTTSGVKFISYAVWWIRSYIEKAIDSYGHSIVRVPTNKGKKLLKCLVDGKENTLSGQDALLLPLISAPTALDAPIDSDTGSTIGDVIGDPRSLDDFAQMEIDERDRILRELVNTLPGRDKRVVEEAYFGSRTNVEMQDDIKLSRERIRQIKNRALERIRGSRGKGTIASRLLEELC